MFVPKHMRNENYFIGWTTNYGRKKGLKGSGGWGIGPNIEYSWYELNEENLKRFSPSNNHVYLGNGEIHYK